MPVNNLHVCVYAHTRGRVLMSFTAWVENEEADVRALSPLNFASILFSSYPNNTNLGEKFYFKVKVMRLNKIDGFMDERSERYPTFL